MTQTSKPRTCEECCEPITSDQQMSTKICNPWDDEILSVCLHAECVKPIVTRMWGWHYGERLELAPAGHCSRCRKANAEDGNCWVAQGEPRARFCLACACVAEAMGVTLVHRPTISQILTQLEWEAAGIGSD